MVPRDEVGGVQSLDLPGSRKTLHNKAEADAQQVAVEDSLWGRWEGWLLQLQVLRLSMATGTTTTTLGSGLWVPPQIPGSKLGEGGGGPALCTLLETEPNLEH